MSAMKILPTDRFVGVCVDDGFIGDVLGMLMMKVGNGWCIVGEHISSSEGWSDSDIGRMRIELGIPDVQYKWFGYMHHAMLKATYPPATEEEMAADDRVREL
jgi:hypothetical protein